MLGLADDALVLGHRLSEWSGKAPMLEEDIALSNLALDLIGQARLLYAYAGEIEGNGRDEDALAYLRDEHAYANLLIAEQPNGDFAATMVRHLLYAAFMHPYFQALQSSSDTRLAEIAAKAVKEMAYHVRHASEWVIRLGDGTEESHARAAGGAGRSVDVHRRAVRAVRRRAERWWAAASPSIATAIRPAWEATVDRVLARSDAEAPGRPLDADRRPRRPARRTPGPPPGRDAGDPPRASRREMVSAMDRDSPVPAPLRKAGRGFDAQRGMIPQPLRPRSDPPHRAAAVLDPEIPVLTLEDLGVLRGVERREGRIVVKLTPTYTGCPATLAIRLASRRRWPRPACRTHGWRRCCRRRGPPTTSPRRAAASCKTFGIAPPNRAQRARALFGEETVACPKCGSTATARISEFGSTACKALWRCKACAEPFDYFKCI